MDCVAAIGVGRSKPRCTLLFCYAMRRAILHADHIGHGGLPVGLSRLYGTGNRVIAGNAEHGHDSRAGVESEICFQLPGVHRIQVHEYQLPG